MIARDGWAEERAMADYKVESKNTPSRRNHGVFAHVAAWWGEIVQEVPPELARCEFECRSPCSEACSRKGGR
jgi:hypothetical protein